MHPGNLICLSLRLENRRAEMFKCLQCGFQHWFLVHGAKKINFVDTQKLHKIIQGKQQDLWHIFEYDMKKLEIWSEIWEIFMDNEGRYRENMTHIRDAYLLIRYGQEYMNKEV
jgi:hypothetical protein